MSDKPRNFSEELASVRPLTRHLISSVLLDQWPNNPAVVAFGIHSQEHYEALYYPIRAQEISPKQLDAAMGDGAALTSLVRDAPSNPHKEIEFVTLRSILADTRYPEPEQTNQNTKDRDIER
jgi:hypothetical protein